MCAVHTYSYVYQMQVVACVSEDTIKAVHVCLSVADILLDEFAAILGSDLAGGFFEGIQNSLDDLFSSGNYSYFFTTIY